MIHVAPCSCELHVRIRELEAALEKARIQRNQLETHQTPYVLELQARAEKAEARVAELEAELHMEQMRVHDLKQDMEEGLDYLRVREQQLAIEEQEREAD